jgi:16S rRNA G527 N7-methylase RsmG
MKLALPWVRLVMFEVRERKAAFLREAVRQLGIDRATVEARRLEDFAREHHTAERADVVTLRGVRLDAALGGAISSLLTSRGWVMVFRSVNSRLSLRGTGLTRTGELLPVGANSVAEILHVGEEV